MVHPAAGGRAARARRQLYASRLHAGDAAIVAPDRRSSSLDRVGPDRDHAEASPRSVPASARYSVAMPGHDGDRTMPVGPRCARHADQRERAGRRRSRPRTGGAGGRDITSRGRATADAGRGARGSERNGLRCGSRVPRRAARAASRPPALPCRIDRLPGCRVGRGRRGTRRGGPRAPVPAHAAGPDASHSAAGRARDGPRTRRPMPPPIRRPIGSTILRATIGRASRRAIDRAVSLPRSSVVAIIPARYQSTRLPGKPCADRRPPMIEHVYRRAAARPAGQGHRGHR